MALVLQKSGICGAQPEAGLSFFLGRTLRRANQKISAYAPFTRGCCGFLRSHGWPGSGSVLGGRLGRALDTLPSCYRN